MEHVEYPIFSVQHHPEAGPGPNDALDVLRDSDNLLDKWRFY